MIKINREIIYFHIPKVAGISLLDFCEKNKITHYGHDVRQKNYKTLYDYIKDKKTKTFTFVRNPWDRLVSAFFYLNNGGREIEDKEDKNKYIAKYNSNFERFVENEFNKRRIFKQLHFMPQHFWITKNNRIIVDYIGKLENLEEDFSYICKKIGKKYEKISTKNKTRHLHYKNYYNTRTKKLVYAMYARDIEMFNYKF